MPYDTSILTQASTQWASRPADERFTSLLDLQAFKHRVRSNSRAIGASTRQIEAVPVAGDNKSLQLVGPAGAPVDVSHWAFGQLAQRAGAPAGYLRNLPAPLAADNLNYGLKFNRTVEDLGLLLSRTDSGNVELRAATGPQYGRIWDADIIDALVSRFGDGVTGNFRVPGIFGKTLAEVTKENTTLYASDRDCFVFLADEANRIEVPNRRDGKEGLLARGFFVWNSEVGASTFGVSTFLFDYVCQNRIVWGASEVKEIKIRHTSGAPDRFVEEIAPALQAYANSSTASIDKALEQARKSKIEEDVDAFLARRFTRGQVVGIQAAHVADEGRPIETIWDAVTGVTAYAREIPNTSDRIQLERAGGALLDLVA